jgi:hypothetical protein
MSVFSLRLREPGLRELVREVANQEDISQNELIEQAVANEVLLRGATLVADLERAAARIAELTEAEYARVVDRSLTDFAEGEGQPEPLQAYAVDLDQLPKDVPEADSLGVIAAFNSARD